MIVLLDNGHGSACPNGAPDKSIMEWSYCRRLADSILENLVNKEVKVVLITPENEDISLSKRCERANMYCRGNSNNYVFVSLHLNASGNGGQWMNGSGWECYTTKGKTNADILAECFYDEARKLGLKVRTDMSDGDSDKESGLYVLKNTICPAVLTENLFQDNKSDVEYLLSTKGFNTIVDLHVNGILSYIDKMK